MAQRFQCPVRTPIDLPVGVDEVERLVQLVRREFRKPSRDFRRSRCNMVQGVARAPFPALHVAEAERAVPVVDQYWPIGSVADCLVGFWLSHKEGELFIPTHHSAARCLLQVGIWFCALCRLRVIPRIPGVPAHAYIITALLAYLIGSIPTGFLVARAKGVDIRKTGSGNIGATNAFRVLGKGWGIGVLLLDFGKGLGACLLIPFAVRGGLDLSLASEGAVTLSLVAAVAAVLGHNFTVWLRFKGGKGIATSAGALAALVPWALLVGVAVWVLLFALTRYVSLGSIAAAIALPVATWFTAGEDVIPLTLLTGALALMAVLKHRSNIQRLLTGTENRLEFGRTRKGEC